MAIAANESGFCNKGETGPWDGGMSRYAGLFQLGVDHKGYLEKYPEKKKTGEDPYEDTKSLHYLTFTHILI